jgi:hypothetical protein
VFMPSGLYKARAKPLEPRALDGGVGGVRQKGQIKQCRSPAVGAKMIIDTTKDSPLGRAVSAAIANTSERRTAADAERIASVVAAFGVRAVVHGSVANLLQAQLSPQPSPERLQRVVQAARAVGAELMVTIVPACETYEAEEAVLHAGVSTYVVVRCAPLVEELAAASFSAAQAQRLTRGVTTAELLSETITRALQDATWQNKTVEVPTIRPNPAQKAVNGAAASPSFADEVCGWLGLPPVPAFALEQATPTR